VAVVVGLVFASLLILPILFSLKCDNTLGRSAPWVAIWTPMWVVDGMMLISAVLLIMDRDEITNDEGEVINKPVPMYTKLANLASTVSFILIQIFVTMHLDHYIHWSWFAEFAPWFAYELLNVLSVLPTVLTRVPLPTLELSKLNAEEGEVGDDELMMRRVALENEYFEKSATQLNDAKYAVVYLLRIWLAVFLALKLDLTVDWSWPQPHGLLRDRGSVQRPGSRSSDGGGRATRGIHGIQGGWNARRGSYAGGQRSSEKAKKRSSENAKKRSSEAAKQRGSSASQPRGSSTAQQHSSMAARRKPDGAEAQRRCSPTAQPQGSPAASSTAAQRLSSTAAR
jgi:hypothetical protein